MALNIPAIAICIVISLFAELGRCTPELNHNRRSLDSTSRNRNTVDLTCREDGSEILGTFWNGSTPLNPTPSTNFTHTLTPETEAGIVCSNNDGEKSNELKLAALPLELNIQDNPPRVQCVPRGGEVELTCEYPPGNLRELYSVQWRFRENDNDDVIFGFGPNGVPLPSGNLLSIDEGTFALTVEIERLDQTGDQFHCDVNVRRNNIGSNVVRYIGAIVELNVQEPVEIGEVEDVTVDIGEVASFICVATGTDVTISWEIEGQRYTDCSNEDFCVNTTEIDSMSVSSTIAIDSSSTIAANAMSTMPNDVRVQCIALQMCGAVSSNGTLIFQEPTTSPPPTPTATRTGGIDDPVLPEEVRTLIFILSGIVAFIIVVVLVLASCVCSLRILYNRGKISTDSRVIRNRPLLQRMISGDRAPRVQYPHEPDHDYEHLDAELGIINPQDGGSGFIYQPRSDISDPERVSQIYNWSRGSGGSSSHVPGHLLRATPSVSIPGSQTNLQQPFNRNSYAASESEFYQKLFPNSEGTQSTGNLPADITRVSPVPPLGMMPPGSSNYLSPPTNPESVSPSPLADEILRYVVGCLMHRRDCQIPRCPCKDVQQRYQEMLMRDTDTTRATPRPPPQCGDKKHHLHLSLSQQNLGSNEHPHWHLHTKSHIRRTQQPLFVRQRSKSVDLTPIMETRETPVIEKRLTPAPIDENRVLRRHSLKTEADCDTPDGPRKDPDWRPPLLREISLSADNLPALCLNNCPLTPSPLRENRTLAAAAMSPLREERSRWVHKPKLGMLAENCQSAESSSEEGSNTSSRTTSAASVEETAEKQPQEGKNSPAVQLPSQLRTSTSVPESGYDTNCSDTEGNSDKLSRKHHELTSVYTLPPSSPPATQRDSRSNSSPPLPKTTQPQERSPIHLQHRQNRERSPVYRQKHSPTHLGHSPTHLGHSPTHQYRGRDARGRSPLRVSEVTVTQTLC